VGDALFLGRILRCQAPAQLNAVFGLLLCVGPLHFSVKNLFVIFLHFGVSLATVRKGAERALSRCRQVRAVLQEARNFRLGAFYIKFPYSLSIGIDFFLGKKSRTRARRSPWIALGAYARCRQRSAKAWGRRTRETVCA
jgi:hypothetical protein